MRIAAVWPGIYMGFNILGKGFEQSAINHGLSSISAVIKGAGHDCFLLDMRGFIDWANFENIVKNTYFDMCIMGFYSVDAVFADRALRIIKSHHPGKPIIVGGVHVTYNQLETFSVADCVVWGEGESVILDLVGKVQSGEALPPKVIAPIVKDLDSIPNIDRGLFNSECEKAHPLLPLLPVPNYTINFSRGCTNRCSFCSQSKRILFRGYRVRSVERCINELCGIRTDSPIGSLMIHDDLFPPGKWCEEFIHKWNAYLPRIPFWCQMRADQIVRHPEHIVALAQMGMTWVSLGIEGSERMREFYNKKVTTDQIIKASELLHANGVNIFGNYICGSPTETEADLKALCDMLEVIKPEWHSQSMYTAYPGSKLYDYCVDNKLFVGDGTKDSDYYSMQRYPYHRKVVGVNYERLNTYWGPKMSQHRNPLKQYNPANKVVVPDTIKDTVNKSDITLSGSATKPCKSCLNTPKVSIILTSYNRPKFLTEAIQSILNQTLQTWELIIVDGYSTDKRTIDIIKQAAKDPRVKAFTTNYDCNNISVEWNLGIAKASGRYIALLDNDNHKLPEFCSKMSSYLDTHPEKDAVACFNRVIDGEGKPTGNIFEAPAQMTKANILIRNHVDSGCMMWRRSVMDKIGWFDERLKTTEDWDFVIRLVHETQGFGIIETPLADYRWHKENRTFVARDLGLKLHQQFITQIKPYGAIKGVTLFHQDRDNLTLSQNNVLDGVRDGLLSIDNVYLRTIDVSHQNEIGTCDYIIVFAPFVIPVENMKRLRPLCREVMYFHCEDPQAIVQNLERAPFADFISSNDKAAIPLLETAVGRGNVAYCPSISFNDAKIALRDRGKIKRDVVFVGYPYESRVKFMKKLVPLLEKNKLNYLLVGDDWQLHFSGTKCRSTIDEQETMLLMEESRIVLLYNRKNTDCGGDRECIKPLSVVRGYFEAASGAIIMLDDSRPYHDLGDLAVYYSSPAHAVKKIMSIKCDYKKMQEYYGDNIKEKALSEWTYRTRIQKLFNIFRNRRFFQEVK